MGLWGIDWTSLEGHEGITYTGHPFILSDLASYFQTGGGNWEDEVGWSGVGLVVVSGGRRQTAGGRVGLE